MNKRVMKKMKFLSAFIALFTAVSFTSCQVEQLDSELLETPEEVTGPALFMVDFGDDTLIATTAQATVSGNALSIIGLRGANGEAIGINIATITGTGVYTSPVLTYMPSGTSTTSYSNTNPANGTTNGAVNITSINTTTKTISGTFSFTGYVSDTSLNLPAVPFTNGIFQNIPYTGNMPGTNPGPGPGPTPTGDSYWPMAVNNTWAYDVPAGNNFEMKILSTETIDGNVFYKYNTGFAFNDPASPISGTFWSRQAGNDYFVRIKLAPLPGGLEQSAWGFTILKDNLNVGQTWQETATQVTTIPGLPAVSMDIDIEGTIVEKGISLTVGSQTYQDVIHVTIEQMYDMAPSEDNIAHYYFAKGVGIVKIFMPDMTPPQTQNLSSHTLN